MTRPIAIGAVDRGLGLFAIGLVFGGGIGFLVAAGYGITLDGHDHAAGHAGHAAGHGGADHAMMHEQVLDLEPGATAPKLDVLLSKDPVVGWNLFLKTENFRFAPEQAGLENTPGEGHAHVYVNGVKLARLYGPWFHLAEAPAGGELRVGLYANSHQALAVGGVAISTTLTLPSD